MKSLYTFLFSNPKEPKPQVKTAQYGRTPYRTYTPYGVTICIQTFVQHFHLFYIPQVSLSEEILAKLIGSNSRTTSRSTTVAESVMRALSSARTTSETIKEEEFTLAILDSDTRSDSKQSTDTIVSIEDSVNPKDKSQHGLNTTKHDSDVDEYGDNTSEQGPIIAGHVSNDDESGNKNARHISSSAGDSSSVADSSPRPRLQGRRSTGEIRSNSSGNRTKSSDS